MQATDVVYQATGFRLYTPSNNILSQEYVTFYLTQDCDVNLTDKEGHDENSVPFKAGYHPILVQKIRAVSAGLVYILVSNKLN
jgi:hypothetical protein